jgi:hypothetical protein
VTRAGTSSQPHSHRRATHRPDRIVWAMAARCLRWSAWAGSGRWTHIIGVTRASQDRLALLVVPPEAAGQAAQRAMTMAADATNGAGPAAILTAAGIASEDLAQT